MHELAWEHFERLCVSLFLAEGGGVDCRQHGRQGSWQGGIDLLASRRDGGTTAVQCKRVKNFGPSHVEKAVAEFLQGPWRKDADEFILCTTNDLRTATKAIMRVRRLLHQHKISLTVLDAPMLSTRLKAHPKLVADFFGSAWETAFCGGRSAAAADAAPPPPEAWRETWRTVLSEPPDVEWTAPRHGKQPGNLRLPRNPHFCGRTPELEKVRTLLLSGSAVAVTQAVTVHGLGGIGKTQLANEYAWRYSSAYGALLWIPAESPTALMTGLANLARTRTFGTPRFLAEPGAGPSASALAAAALGWLGSHDDWLLILDNADTLDSADLITELLPRLGRGHLIITSRRSVWNEVFATCRLGVLPLEESVTYLLERCPDAGDAALARRLANRLGCLPLALAQAAACIQAEHLSFASYLTELRGSSRLPALHRLPPGMLSYPKPVAETWAITLGRLHPTTVTLLELFAWFSPDDIPRQLLQSRIRIENNAADASDPLTFRQALDQLSEYSLVTLSADSIIMHRLLQAVVQDGMPVETRVGRLRMAMKIIADLGATKFGADDVRAWKTWRLLASHAISMLESAQRLGLASDEMTEIGHRLTSHLLARSQYAEALPLACRAVSIMRRMYGRDHQHVATSLGMVASSLADAGFPNKALRVQQKVLEIDRRACGPRSEEVAIDLSNLGIYLLDSGRHREAEPVLRRAADLHALHFGKDHPTHITARLNVASVLQENGKSREAVEIYRGALAATERHFGSAHPEMCTVLNGLALAYIGLDRPAKAAPCARRALEIARRRLGPRHSLIPLLCNTLARVSHAGGDLALAARWQKKSLALCEEIHGPDHPSTLASLGNLAALHADMDRLSEAMRCFAEVARREERVLGPDDPRLAIRLSNLADLHHRQKNLSEAAALYHRVLALDECAHGSDHVEVAEDLRHLATVLLDNNHSAEALPFIQRALGIYRMKPRARPDGHARARALHKRALADIERS